MSIETKIDELITALNANTAALKGSAGAGSGKTASTTTSTASGGGKKEAKAAYEAKHTKAEAQALANRVKEEKGVPQIRAIIKGLGYEKLADIVKPEDLDKLAAQALEALGEADDGGAGDGDDGI